MNFDLYDYLDSNMTNDFKEWTNSLEKRDRAKLNAKLDMLEKNGPDLFPHVLAGTHTPGIQKLRVKGNVKLRPMVCSGPISPGREYTLLISAKEVQSKIVPNNADQTAGNRKAEIVGNPARRVDHERVS